ncbi:ankyrin repeat, SAM and basic leucine zipper domain-containing protein 1 [Chrysoperla carnea]|uniref:ankyrin repeat, SAM and basic leucine zipper domain-containing protein 1 n=1 Tax=Chrysoperla carnea TaxID=189513 RepID=UPI001D073114|nr:ankyrin repeat, SAM and basic leucine zipper domain-containing protein 1 [Chrysoperla carnea]
MIIRPAGLSSSDEDDDYDGFGYINLPSRKTSGNSTSYKRNLGEPWQTVDKKISVMEQIKNSIQSGNVEELANVLSSDVPGLDINGEFESTAWTPLLYAASLGNAEIVSELLINGADPNIHKDSYTPLMAVCSCELERDENLVQCASDLISFNAKVKVADRYGMTPLMFAALHGHEQLVSLLMPLSDLEAVDTQKWTALFFAVSRGHKNVVEQLLYPDMDLSKTDIRGSTVKELAINKGYLDIAELVTDPNALDLVTLEDIETNTAIPEWEDMFPGIKDTKNLPPYFDDVKSFMYGINLPQFIDLMYSHKIGFPTLLTITDGQLECMGILLPFQRRQILHGLYEFHGHRWNKKSLGEIPKELFSVYDVLHNFGASNKHISVMKSSIQFLHMRLNYMKNTKNIMAGGDEKENIQGLHDNKTAILKELNDLKYRIESIKCTLHKLRNRMSKVIHFIYSYNQRRGTEEKS